MVIRARESGTEPLTRRTARSARGIQFADFSPDVIANAKLCWGAMACREGLDRK
jgi:hypothetical protein